MRVRERCPDCGAKLDHVDRTRAPWIRVLDFDEDLLERERQQLRNFGAAMALAGLAGEVKALGVDLEEHGITRGWHGAPLTGDNIERALQEREEVER